MRFFSVQVHDKDFGTYLKTEVPTINFEEATARCRHRKERKIINLIFIFLF